MKILVARCNDVEWLFGEGVEVEWRALNFGMGEGGKHRERKKGSH